MGGGGETAATLAVAAAASAAKLPTARAASDALMLCCCLPLLSVAHLAGKGGTGDTWHFKDMKNGRDVAVKFIKRPLPKVLQTNILREFTVRGGRRRGGGRGGAGGGGAF